MKIVFAYQRNGDHWPLLEKTFTLPDTSMGAIAIVNGGRFIELATILEDGSTVAVLWPVNPAAAMHENVEALAAAVVAHQDASKRKKFKERFAAYVDRNPAATPLALALYAKRLVDEIGLSLEDLDDDDHGDDDGGLDSRHQDIAGHGGHQDGGHQDGGHHDDHHNDDHDDRQERLALGEASA